MFLVCQLGVDYARSFFFTFTVSSNSEQFHATSMPCWSCGLNANDPMWSVHNARSTEARYPTYESSNKDRDFVQVQQRTLCSAE